MKFLLLFLYFIISNITYCYEISLDHGDWTAFTYDNTDKSVYLTNSTEGLKIQSYNSNATGKGFWADKPYEEYNIKGKKVSLIWKINGAGSFASLDFGTAAGSMTSDIAVKNISGVYKNVTDNTWIFTEAFVSDTEIETKHCYFDFCSNGGTLVNSTRSQISDFHQGYLDKSSIYVRINSNASSKAYFTIKNIDISDYSSNIVVGKATLDVAINGLNLFAAWSSAQNAASYYVYYAVMNSDGSPGIDSIGYFETGANELSVKLWSNAAFYLAVAGKNGNIVGELSNIENFRINNLNYTQNGNKINILNNGILIGELTTDSSMEYPTEIKIITDNIRLQMDTYGNIIAAYGKIYSFSFSNSGSSQFSYSGSFTNGKTYSNNTATYNNRIIYTSDISSGIDCSLSRQEYESTLNSTEEISSLIKDVEAIYFAIGTIGYAGAEDYLDTFKIDLIVYKLRRNLEIILSTVDDIKSNMLSNYDIQCGFTQYLGTFSGVVILNFFYEDGTSSSQSAPITIINNPDKSSEFTIAGNTETGILNSDGSVAYPLVGGLTKADGKFQSIGGIVSGSGNYNGNQPGYFSWTGVWNVLKQ